MPEDVQSPPPSPPREPTPDPSSISSLGLSLEDIDQVQLSTLDGEDANVENIGKNIADDDSASDADADAGPTLDISRPGPSYFIVRKDQMEGPMPFSRISERAAAGDLDPDDRVQDRTNGEEYPVCAVPVLQRLLETVDERRELLRFSQQRAAPRTGPAPKPPPARPRDRRGLVTLGWVVVALAAFAGAGWWLMQ